jgi:hypothetical protein
LSGSVAASRSALNSGVKPSPKETMFSWFSTGKTSVAPERSADGFSAILSLKFAPLFPDRIERAAVFRIRGKDSAIDWLREFYGSWRIRDV